MKMSKISWWRWHRRRVTCDVGVSKVRHLGPISLRADNSCAVSTNIVQTVAFFLSYSCFPSHSFTMASATRLPLKSILFTTAIVASTGASRVNLRNLLIRTFTGPGSYSRIAAILIVLANLKNVPGTWHVCNCTTKTGGYYTDID